MKPAGDHSLIERKRLHMEEKWTVEGACQAEPRSAVAFGARLDRGDQRGFLRSASAGAKLFSKLGTYLIVPRYLTASTKNFFAFGLSSVSRHDKLLSLLSSFALSKVPSMPLPAPTIRPTVVSRGPTRTTRISTQVE